MNEKILNFAKISTLAVLLAFGITQVSSWTAPTAVPPDGNVAAPINVGNATQTKAGNLTAGSLTSNGDIDVTGDNLINVSTPIAPADGVNKAYVDAQGGVGGGGSGGGIQFSWGYTDKHYFITDAKYNGNLGGFAGADAKCNADKNAIPGKSYHAVFDVSDFNLLGVGLYNDDIGWANSKLTVFPINSSGVTYPGVNENPSGNGAHVRVLPAKVIKYPVEVGEANLAKVPEHWADLSAGTNNCMNWTSSSIEDKAGAAKEIDAGASYIGAFSSGILNTGCGSVRTLMCLEN